MELFAVQVQKDDKYDQMNYNILLYAGFDNLYKEIKQELEDDDAPKESIERILAELTVENLMGSESITIETLYGERLYIQNLSESDFSIEQAKIYAYSLTSNSNKRKES